jgi:carbon-monoxide dehydrogenase medium subunit
MRPFKYVRPKRLDDAFAVLAEHGAKTRVLAGGTDVLMRLRMGHMRPDVVLDIKDVAELSDGIVETDGVIRIGARAVMTDLVEDPRIQRHFPALVDAAAVVGSIQIRNRATPAGNLCNASPAADTPPAFLVYDATVNLVGRSGHRAVPMTEFFLGPGKTVLQPGELVGSIDLPVPKLRTGSAFGRITRRYGVDLATVNLVCRIDETGETRFGYGAVGPRPFLVRDRSGALADPSTPAGRQAAVLRELIAESSPISDVRGGKEYRLAMLDVMSRRAIEASRAQLRGA